MLTVRGDIEKPHWGALPKKMRPFWIAQRAICPYCSKRLSLERKRCSKQATWDHVRPLAMGGGQGKPNRVVAHRSCNQGKGDRAPTSCELFYCVITNEIAISEQTSRRLKKNARGRVVRKNDTPALSANRAKIFSRQDERAGPTQDQRDLPWFSRLSVWLRIIFGPPRI